MRTSKELLMKAFDDEAEVFVGVLLPSHCKWIELIHSLKESKLFKANDGLDDEDR